MIRARLMISATAGAVALLVVACGSAQHTAGGTGSPAATPVPSLTSSAAATPGRASSAAANTGPVTSASTGPASSTARPAVSTSACAALAAHTFVHVTAVKAGIDGSLTLTGNPATLICGGFDDLHYDVATTTVSGHVIPGASIMVFPAPPMHLVAIRPSALASYLATDEDTRIFLVTGPLSRITGLQEEFHP